MQIFQQEHHPSVMGLGQAKEGLSVFGMLNKCVTPMGRRLLQLWFVRPIINLQVKLRHCLRGCLGALIPQHPCMRPQQALLWQAAVALRLRADASASQTSTGSSLASAVERWWTKRKHLAINAQIQSAIKPRQLIQIDMLIAGHY